MFMTRVAWLVVGWLVACGGHEARPTRPGATRSAAPGPEAAAPVTPPVTPPVSAPHGGQIALIAITDRGDAALTADEFFELRLWPTFDGRREPVIVHGPRAIQLAIGRDRDTLYGALLDQAGSVEVLRFDPRGGLLGRVQLPGQPAIAQVVAVPGGVLVRRVDHSVEQFDPRGARLGRIVAAPGQRVVSLAARRDRAIAGISVGDPRATQARWIRLGGGLAWGAAIDLPEPLDELALAPGGHRLAGLTSDEPARGGAAKPQDEAGQAQSGVIIELEPRPVVAATLPLEPVRPMRTKGRRLIEPDAPTAIGFVTDDKLAIGVADQLQWVSVVDSVWATAPGSPPEDGVLAITDRVVAGSQAALSLLTYEAEQVLGYRWLGETQPRTPSRFRRGHGVLVDVQRGRLWLDAQLTPRPPTDDPELRDLQLMLDDHHALFTPLGNSIPLETRLVIRDLATHQDTEIARFEDLTSAQYDPGTHVLAVALRDSIVRYRLAFAPVTATPLRTLVHTGELSPFTLTDPALAHGIVAVVTRDTDVPRAAIYRLAGEDHGRSITPELVRTAGPVVAIDRTGAIYAGTDAVEVYPDGLEVPSHPAAASIGRLGIDAISHAGALFASTSDNQITVFDPTGAVVWRRPVWRAGPAAWSDDDRTLFTATDGGGVISFDAATGRQLAIRCGWGFGLFTASAANAVASAANAPSACDRATP